MIQQINLYRPERYAPERTTAVNSLLAVIGVAVGLVIAYYILSQWQLNQARLAAGQLEEQRGALNRQRDELNTRLQQLQPSIALQSELSNLERDRDAKRQVLRLLDGDAAGNRTGFSGHLEGLARRPLNGLWLTGVSIERGGRHLALRGNALTADLLPRYLELLRDEAAFAGQEFRMLTMNRPESDAARIEFHLDSGASGGGKDE